MRVAVLQSNYIPWKGYFDIIHDVDRFVFYDDVQYTTNDWRNRNRIKTAQGPQWLTIPVGKHMHRRICDVALPSDGDWMRTHLRRIEQAYASSPHVARVSSMLQRVWLERPWSHLSCVNQALIAAIAREWLGISTEFLRSSDIGASGAASDRLLDLLVRIGATEYVSGPAAKAYLDEHAFAEAGIQVIWKDYARYPAYAQPHGEFRHDVSVIDLLCQTGDDAAWHIWGWRHEA